MGLFSSISLVPKKSGKFKIIIHFKQGTDFGTTVDLPDLFDQRNQAVFRAKEIMTGSHFHHLDKDLVFPNHSLSHAEIVEI